MVHKQLLSVLTILLLPSVYAQGTAVRNVFSIIESIFDAVLNPSITGLAILTKFLLVIIIFAVFYWVLYEKLEWKQKGTTALIAGAFALGAGLAIPLQVALTISTIYAAIIISILVIIPFVVLSLWTYNQLKEHIGEEADAEGNNKNAKFYYMLLAFFWFVYFIILTYFVNASSKLVQDVVGTWLLYLLITLTILSPLIMLALLYFALTWEDDEETQTAKKEAHKKWWSDRKKEGVKKIAKHTIDFLSHAKTALARAQTRTTSKQQHQDITRAIQSLNHAKSNAEKIAKKATELLIDDTIPSGDPRVQEIESAKDLRAELLHTISDLRSLLDENAIPLLKAGTKSMCKRVRKYQAQVLAVSQFLTK